MTLAVYQVYPDSEVFTVEEIYLAELHYKYNTF
jgi:hypothetical protein